MFSKAGSKTSKVVPPLTSDTKITAKPPALSIISADMKIVGSIDHGGDVQIDGIVEGDVASRSVTVSETATVRGSISAEIVRVSGTVNGGVSGKTVALARTARVEGDIRHQELAIEPGAKFEGHCRRVDDSGRNEPKKIPLISDVNAGDRRIEGPADRPRGVQLF